MSKNREWRVTIPGRYGPGTPGHTDPSARQGHYVGAVDEAGAASLVREQLRLRAGEPMDVQPWDDGPVPTPKAVRVTSASLLPIMVTVEYTLTHEMLDDLMTTAYEGGINYWCARVTRDPEAPRWEATLTTLEGELCELTLGGIVAAAPVLAKQWPEVWQAFVSGNYDAAVADTIVQVALFSGQRYA